MTEVFAWRNAAAAAKRRPQQAGDIFTGSQSDGPALGLLQVTPYTGGSSLEHAMKNRLHCPSLVAGAGHRRHGLAGCGQKGPLYLPDETAAKKARLTHPHSTANSHHGPFHLPGWPPAGRRTSTSGTSCAAWEPPVTSIHAPPWNVIGGSSTRRSSAMPTSSATRSRRTPTWPFCRCWRAWGRFRHRLGRRTAARPAGRRGPVARGVFRSRQARR